MQSSGYVYELIMSFFCNLVCCLCLCIYLCYVETKLNWAVDLLTYATIPISNILNPSSKRNRILTELNQKNFGYSSFIITQNEINITKSEKLLKMSTRRFESDFMVSKYVKLIGLDRI